MALLDGLRDLLSPILTYRVAVYDEISVETLDTAALYRTQPNLRTVVSFLADNAAQVPIKVHDRAADDDRPRVTDSPAALLLQRPNPDMTAYELRRWTYSDMYLYGRCHWLVTPSAGAPSGYEVRPIPVRWVIGYEGGSAWAPDTFVVAPPESPQVRIPRESVVMFHNYDPVDPMRSYSPVAALKDVLHEQVESNAFRRQMWRRGGRFNAYIARPKQDADWTDEAFERFKQTWDESWAGDDAAQAGKMPILEDGMRIEQVQFNSRDAQWADAKKLGREDVAGVYHVNPAMIWPGSGQTYASARDNARQLYNDTLAPQLMEVTDRLTLDLFAKVGEPTTHYCAYDITVKTEGTFEEKVAALQTAVGAPFLSREEARARLNLPAQPRGELIVPLNVLAGGLASNHDTDPTRERYNASDALTKSAPATDGAEEPDDAIEGADEPERIERKSTAEPTDDDSAAMTDVYARFFERQSRSVLPKLAASEKSGEPTWWDAERWNRELAEDLYDLAIHQSEEAALRTLRELAEDAGAYSVERTEAFVRAICERRAEGVNEATLADLQAALADELGEDALQSTPQGVYEHATETRAPRLGMSIAACVAAWSALEAVRQSHPKRETPSGPRRDAQCLKTWVHHPSKEPRSNHVAMSGETVDIDDRFSNGADWPGDDTVGPAETCYCHCTVEVHVITE